MTTNDNPKPARRRANDLTGSEWTRYSISVWNDIRKTPEEQKLGHPAAFPISLVSRLIRCYTTPTDEVVLDPFAGSGSTLVAAQALGKRAIGIDISPEYIELARSRLAQTTLFGAPEPKLIVDDSRNLTVHIDTNSIDFCVTSPPYWDILSQKRTADYKEIRDYHQPEGDLSLTHDYQGFLDQLSAVSRQVLAVLKPGKYFVLNVMDLRKKDKFFPLHCDVSRAAVHAGFIFDDIIIWDRRQEYNNLRSLGYPSVFRLNKIHEYLLVFQKPI